MSRDGRMRLRLARFHRVGAAVHAVALSGDGEHLLVGSELGLRLIDRRGNVRYRLGLRAARRSTRSRCRPGSMPGWRWSGRGGSTGSTSSDGGRASGLAVAAVGIWEQRDDLYSLDFAPAAGGGRRADRAGAPRPRADRAGWPGAVAVAAGAAGRLDRADEHGHDRTRAEAADMARDDQPGRAERSMRRRSAERRESHGGDEIVAIDAALGKPVEVGRDVRDGSRCWRACPRRWRLQR